MKTYTVVTDKKTGQCLENNGGIVPGSGNHANDYYPAVGLVKIIKTDAGQLHQYIYHFKLQRQAIVFAIWAAGWVASIWSNHTSPTITL